uniref:Uncharacterized protein n=1 Tax=Trichogramma kaykai TaxID=54128 RepID=A0ABD2X6B9_9HYME
MQRRKVHNAFGSPVQCIRGVLTHAARTRSNRETHRNARTATEIVKKKIAFFYSRSSYVQSPIAAAALLERCQLCAQAKRFSAVHVVRGRSVQQHLP